MDIQLVIVNGEQELIPVVVILVEYVTVALVPLVVIADVYLAHPHVFVKTELLNPHVSAIWTEIHVIVSAEPLLITVGVIHVPIHVTVSAEPLHLLVTAMSVQIHVIV